MRTLGGLLELAAAGILAFLWARGYLTRGLAAAAQYIQSPPPLSPIGSSAGSRIGGK